jgi:UDP-2-acetamido-2,6-beta-L-arabino-hexul-4-ose reductase
VIYGNGLIASSLISYFHGDDRYSIFASGVSNSGEKRVEAFSREKNALFKCVEADRFLVYFSTCSLYDTSILDTPYARHKLEMESICANASSYAIFRLPQVVGETLNPYTLTNFLFNSIKNNYRFKIWRNASRVLIDVEDIASIVAYFLDSGIANNSIINIAHLHALPVLDIVKIFESLLGIKANFDFTDEGSFYSIDCSLANNAARKLLINFDDHYTERLIRKYYAR